MKEETADKLSNIRVSFGSCRVGSVAGRKGRGRVGTASVTWNTPTTTSLRRVAVSLGG